MKRSIAIVAVLLALLVSPAFGQTPAVEQKFHIAVDTAGIMETEKDVFVTWIFALATPTSWPSSGILVAFDCKERKVKRLAQVVYSMKADSSGVEGPIVEVNGEWQKVNIPALFDMVCKIGPTHGPSVVQPTRPEPDPSWRIS